MKNLKHNLYNFLPKFIPNINFIIDKNKERKKKMSISPFKDQDYNELIMEYREDNLFEDPEFDACDLSLYYSKNPSGIVWKRPNVIFI